MNERTFSNLMSRETKEWRSSVAKFAQTYGINEDVVRDNAVVRDSGSDCSVEAVLIKEESMEVLENGDPLDSGCSNNAHEPKLGAMGNTTDKEEIVLLKQMLENQKIIMDRLDSQDVRLARLETMSKENKIEKSEELTQYKMVRECKVLIRRIHQSICKMTGEEVDYLQVEIASIFPLPTLAAAHELEEKLSTQEYHDAMKLFLMRLKGASGSVDDVFRRIYSDEFISFCNWDGRGGKQALSQFPLVSEILYDIFKQDGRTSFEKIIRKSIELSHHRCKQRKYRQKTSTSKLV